jgi:hypothetical protein
MGGRGKADACYYNEPRFRLKFKNESQRRMKYISFGVDGTNSVGDVVESEVLKLTGPFEPGKKKAPVIGQMRYLVQE